MDPSSMGGKMKLGPPPSSMGSKVKLGPSPSSMRGKIKLTPLLNGRQVGYTSTIQLAILRHLSYGVIWYEYFKLYLMTIHHVFACKLGSNGKQLVYSYRKWENQVSISGCSWCACSESKEELVPLECGDPEWAAWKWIQCIEHSNKLEVQKRANVELRLIVNTQYAQMDDLSQQVKETEAARIRDQEEKKK
jgi:hypothetical protein